MRSILSGVAEVVIGSLGIPRGNRLLNAIGFAIARGTSECRNCPCESQSFSLPHYSDRQVSSRLGGC
jgi:hypothetical protein